MKTQSRLRNISSNQWNSSGRHEETNSTWVFFCPELFSTEEGAPNRRKLTFHWNHILNWDWNTMHHTQCFDSIITLLHCFFPFFIFLFSHSHRIIKILLSWKAQRPPNALTSFSKNLNQHHWCILSTQQTFLQSFDVLTNYFFNVFYALRLKRIEAGVSFHDGVNCQLFYPIHLYVSMDSIGDFVQDKDA